MTETGYFETAIDFDGRHFHFEADCVGAEVHFSFKGQHFMICFPNFDFEKPDGFGHPTPTLEGTRVKLAWMRRNSDDNIFGREDSRGTNRVLRFACNHLIIRSRGQIVASEARKAKANLLLWRDVFARWWEVIGYVDLEDHGRVEQEDSLDCYFVYSDEGKKARRVKSKKEGSISIAAISQVGIGKKQLKQILKYSAGGAYPPGYYVQLIDALKHFNQDRYRQSILDSATATEIALTQLLDNKLTSVTPQQRKLIFDKYRQIGGLLEALKALGETLPAGIGAKIGTPRNQAIHKGAEVAQDQARDALQLARTFIYAKLPF